MSEMTYYAIDTDYRYLMQTFDLLIPNSVINDNILVFNVDTNLFFY
jgi:hypothetical protein